MKGREGQPISRSFTHITKNRDPMLLNAKMRIDHDPVIDAQVARTSLLKASFLHCDESTSFTASK